MGKFKYNKKGCLSKRKKQRGNIHSILKGQSGGDDEKSHTSAM